MTAFATLEDYVTAFPGSLPDAQANETATAALDAACSDIRLYCAQTFDLVETDEVELHGTGRATLLLPQLPVVAINTVTINKGLTSELVVTDYRCELSTGVLFRAPSTTVDPWCAGYAWTSAWPVGFLNITVDYDHGYTTIPASLVRVAVRLAHDDIVNPGSRLSGETIAGYAYTKATGEPSVEDYAKALEPFRNKRVPVA